MAEKLYYSIKEVARTIGVTEPTLRYWEKEFDNIRPRKTASGIRQYRQQDIDEIRTVHFLLKEKGFSIAEAKKQLKEKRVGVDASIALRDRLIALRDELLALKDEIDKACPEDPVQ